ncbi:hypothetical protein G7Z17_g8095 [Cylindrodendrum hubeiense]|uniref:Uncharacterized protein n=1 Tax=Cylindrodendrum hubeiense TaxID=595255 RepID=A0A9P5H6L1_9HYPO|nr:hypothetical protein G7Z17_g8095 [Cylindrodendrum hubeiense]
MEVVLAKHRSFAQGLMGTINGIIAIVVLLAAGAFVKMSPSETYGRNDGLMDHRFFESRNFALILSVSFVDGMLLYGVNAFLPQEIAGLFTHDPIIISIYLLPLNVCLIGGILGSAYVLGVYNNYRRILTISMVLIAVFCGLLALITPSRKAMMLVFTGLIGLGIGVTTVIPVVVLTYAVPSHLLALGGIIGITIFATVHGNYIAAHQAPSVASAAIEAGLPNSSVEEFMKVFFSPDPTGITNVSGVTNMVLVAAEHALKLVTVKSFEFVWIANAVIGAITAILTIFLQPVATSMTAHVEAPLEDGKHRDKISPEEGLGDE